MLIFAFHHVFFDFEYHVNHAICMWYMNNNIIINCKKLFFTNELYDEFMKKWKMFCMMKISVLLNEDYNVFYHIYLDVNVHIYIYIEKHIWSSCTRWAKYYIDKFLHFDNIFILQSENAHH